MDGRWRDQNRLPGIGKGVAYVLALAYEFMNTDDYDDDYYMMIHTSNYRVFAHLFMFRNL